MLKLTCDNMRPAASNRANVTLKESGTANDIVIEINGITVAWVTPHGWLEIMNLSRKQQERLNDLGFQIAVPMGGTCGQIKVVR